MKTREAHISFCSEFFRFAASLFAPAHIGWAAVCCLLNDFPRRLNWFLVFFVVTFSFIFQLHCELCLQLNQVVLWCQRKKRDSTVRCTVFFVSAIWPAMAISFGDSNGLFSISVLANGNVFLSHSLSLSSFCHFGIVQWTHAQILSSRRFISRVKRSLQSYRKRMHFGNVKTSRKWNRRTIKAILNCLPLRELHNYLAVLFTIFFQRHFQFRFSDFFFFYKTRMWHRFSVSRAHICFTFILISSSISRVPNAHRRKKKTFSHLHGVILLLALARWINWAAVDCILEENVHSWGDKNNRNRIGGERQRQFLFANI